MSATASADLCAGCAKQPRRHGSSYCTESCRNAKKQRAARGRRHRVPAHEDVVISEIAAGRLTPEDGLLWATHPLEMANYYTAQRMSEAA
jgi:hypothetical protein